MARVTSKLQGVKGGNLLDEQRAPERGMPKHALVHLRTEVWYGHNKIKPSRHGPHEAVGRGLTGKQNAAVMAKSANLGTKIKMWFSRCTRLRRSEDSPDKPSGRSQLRTMGGAPGLCLALAWPAVVLGGDKCTKLKFGSRRRSHKSACPAAALRSKLMKGAACCFLKRSMPKTLHAQLL